MSYLPRRRLVLASADVRSSHTQWPGSELPWDAEEACDEPAFQEQCFSSQLATYTQGPCVSSGLRTAAVQFDQEVDTSTQFDNFCSQSQPLCQDSMADDEPVDRAVYSLPSEQLAALENLSLPSHDYAELYHFLTKGSACVQSASAKERALYKLADLRQVLSMHCCLE